MVSIKRLQTCVDIISVWKQEFTTTLIFVLSIINLLYHAIWCLD